MAIYGLLQAMFLQQDAVKHIAEVLSVELIEDCGLKLVRDTRSDVVGHPTKRGHNPKTFTTHTISRWLMSKAAIEVFSSSEDGLSINPRTIIISDLVKKQRAGIQAQLVSIRDEMQERERNHKMTFSAEPLQSIFPQALEYHIGKLAQGVYDASSAEFGKVNLNYLEEIVDKFRAALEERDELPVNEVLQYKFDEIEHPFVRLKAFFAGEAPAFTSADADVFTFYLGHKLGELRELAIEIDEQYEEV